ncbi:hypothetical protein DSECCO2_405710 [anaerobic digester metagenome]
MEPAGSDGWIMDVKHRFETDAPLEILLPGLRRPVLRTGDYGVENDEGLGLGTAHGGMRVVLRCGHPDLEPGLFLRAAHPEAYGIRSI